MPLTKPRSLQPGANLAILSPASLANPDVVAKGIATLEALGYHPRLFPHALDRGPLNFAGSLQARLGDLHAAFADPSIDAILCTRGGWGAAELLPHLDRALIRANPKPFLGYSDVTSLHIWLQREANLVSFQGPMVASDLSKPTGPLTQATPGFLDPGQGPDLASFHNALTGTAPWTLDAAAGLRILRPGSTSGPLTGGCISIYVESLGTPYAPLPPTGVLFLEDVGVKPYQWSRMLTHLRLAGMLAGVTGIVFGDMRQCAEPAEIPALEAALLHALADLPGPIAIGLRSGHVSGGNITLPFGVQVELDGTDAMNPRMHFVEASVTA